MQGHDTNHGSASFVHYSYFFSFGVSLVGVLLTEMRNNHAYIIICVFDAQSQTASIIAVYRKIHVKVGNYDTVSR